MNFLVWSRQTAPRDYVIWFSILAQQGGRGYSFAAAAMHICVIEEMIRVTIIFLLFRFVYHKFVFYSY